MASSTTATTQVLGPAAGSLARSRWRPSRSCGPPPRRSGGLSRRWGAPGMSAIAAAAGLTAEEVSYVLGLAQSSPLILRRAGIDVGESYRVCFLFFNHGAASPAVGSDRNGGGAETGLSELLDPLVLPDGLSSALYWPLPSPGSRARRSVEEQLQQRFDVLAHVELRRWPASTHGGRRPTLPAGLQPHRGRLADLGHGGGQDNALGRLPPRNSAALCFARV